MTLWPRIDAASSEAAPPALWSGFSATSPEAENAPPVDISAAPAMDFPTPPLDPVALPPASPTKHRTGLLATLALLVSTALHAAVLTFFLDRSSQAGVEAETDAVSVEIVLEAPPAKAVAASSGTAESQAQDVAEPLEAENVEPDITSPIKAERPVEDAPEGADEVAAPATEADQAAEPLPEPPVAQEAAAMAVAPPRDPLTELTPPPPAELAQEEARPEPEEKTFTEALTPEFNAPIPSPRPDYSPPAKARAQQKTAAAKAPAEQAKAGGPKPAKAAARAEAARMDEKSTRTTASTAASAGAKGGASAGAAAKYGQKLLSHVERHKRYPQAAARQKITGATKLAITIDRSGHLASARVAAGSGHAILDQEAVAVARRAAPYPRPPDGVGGGTISFSVTLRFKR